MKSIRDQIASTLMGASIAQFFLSKEREALGLFVIVPVAGRKVLPRAVTRHGRGQTPPFHSSCHSKFANLNLDNNTKSLITLTQVIRT